MWRGRDGTQYSRAMRIVASGEHPRRKVDPFGRLPCRHDTVAVHITDGQSVGDDVVECRPCGYALRLADLYQGLFPGPGGATPGPPDEPEDGR